MTQINRIEIDEELRRDSEVCKRGVQSDFWQLIKKIGVKLQQDALMKLIRTAPTDVGEIAQLQMMVKVVDEFVAAVEDTAKLT